MIKHKHTKLNACTLLVHYSIPKNTNMLALRLEITNTSVEVKNCRTGSTPHKARRLAL